MKLYEHPEFAALVTATREASSIPGITDQLIEKDYFVTEVLRMVALQFPTQAIFKGGTSLSKGWNLIERFSEDVDIFVDPAQFEPPLGKNGIDRHLKQLRDQVAQHPAFTYLPNDSKTSGGFGRSDSFQYPQLFTGVAAIRPAVLLEAGTASGREPVVEIAISSYVGDFLRTQNIDLGAEDQLGFTMRVMHFRRTFVEKLFAIHAKVEIMKGGGPNISTYARHYYDLFRLLRRQEVIDMLRSSEYAEMKDDYEAVSMASFPRDYVKPTDMSFATSDALFPTGELRQQLAVAYETQVADLCFGAYPDFATVEEAFRTVQGLL